MNRMRGLQALVVVCLVASARLAAACPNYGSTCPLPAMSGPEPCSAGFRTDMQEAGAGTLPGGQPIASMGSGYGSAAHTASGWVPCVILSSVGATESDWTHFCANCGGSGATVISFDCGYGIMQITSGVGSPTAGFDSNMVDGNPGYNISVGVNFLIQKWNATATVLPNDPHTAEDWFFALWGYNGLSAGNNPNTNPATRGMYFSPGGSRTGWPYEEVAYGYALHPMTGDDGMPDWPSTQITYPDFSMICASCGNPGSAAVVAAPSPTHSGDCTPAVAPDHAPTGNFDAADCTHLVGWGFDVDTPTQPTRIDLYADGPAGTGQFLTSAMANVNRPDLCTAAGVNSCDHGFDVPTPAMVIDGRAHSIYAYAIDTNPANMNTLLPNAPRTVACANGVMDGGTVADAGGVRSDAAAGGDATGDGGVGRVHGGCGCSTRGGESRGWWVCAWVAVMCVVRRRARR